LIAIPSANHVKIGWVDRAEHHTDEHLSLSGFGVRKLANLQYFVGIAGVAKDECFHFLS
jgi:hypothetical protein